MLHRLQLEDYANTEITKQEFSEDIQNADQSIPKVLQAA